MQGEALGEVPGGGEPLGLDPVPAHRGEALDDVPHAALAQGARRLRAGGGEHERGVVGRIR